MELKRDCAVKQKKGIHFILASIVIWTAVLVIHLLEMNIQMKNLLTFCATAPLMPIAFLISKMLMVLAMIFGAHLMPFGWLYDSKSYMALSIVIPIGILYIGLIYPPFVVAAVMIATEIVFSLLLVFENRQMR